MQIAALLSGLWQGGSGSRVITPSLCCCICRSHGCVKPQCALCEHNPHRRCTENFAPKYLVNDALKAKCEALICVDVVDRATGDAIGDEASTMHLEVCILGFILKRQSLIAMHCLALS